MYAIIETGGKQLKVEQGQVVKVEKLAAQVGETISFDQVLMVAGADGVKLGQPTVAGAVVTGTVLGQGKEAKVVSFRYKRRKRVRVKRGHRQPFTSVKIENISL
ncbi:MAG TPA: 50S ribosomal protein L21 [Firmicutes bacterium]|nr:50S ribosomal protein L21 [Bacillota bacterium]